MNLHLLLQRIITHLVCFAIVAPLPRGDAAAPAVDLQQLPPIDGSQFDGDETAIAGLVSAAPAAHVPGDAVDPLIFDSEVTKATSWGPRYVHLGADPAVDGFPTIGVTGLFQADGIWFAQDTVNEAVVGNAQDVADFRRARMGIKGKAAENVDYMMEYDFGLPGRPSFMDVYLDVADLSPVGRLRVGQWRQPFGMDALTSVRELIFLERALPFALAPFRQIGAGIYDTAMDEATTWAISGYRFPTDVFGDAAGDSGYGLATRETMLFYDGPNAGTVHLGGGYTYNRPSTNAARLRSSPEVGFSQLDFRLTDFPIPFFVDTSPIATESYQVLNGELAGTLGSWLFQSEFYYASLRQTAGGQLGFPGAYALVSYVLTGESHPYNASQGVYSRVVPACNYGREGNGAWEIAGRWSYLDLSDGAIDGGRIDDVTLGLNWYLASADLVPRATTPWPASYRQRAAARAGILPIVIHASCIATARPGAAGRAADKVQKTTAAAPAGDSSPRT